MESICHLFPVRPYLRLISGRYASNMLRFLGLFTFYRLFTGSIGTALSNKYPFFCHIDEF